jgi:L-serine dehydratase
MLPSIFNDVIGPVMRGPSSSHCAAALRIGRLARDLMDGDFNEVLVEFDPNGSLATTHATQGSDMGLCGGLLGWDPTDERLTKSEQEVERAGIRLNIRISDIPADHPNTYQITLRNDRETRKLTALSTGGGMIEVISIDGTALSMKGDCFETLLFVQSREQELADYLHVHLREAQTQILEGHRPVLIEIKSQEQLSKAFLEQLQKIYPITAVKSLSPILPVLSQRDTKVPFTTCSEMIEHSQADGLHLWELALEYESARGGILRAEVFEKMRSIVQIMQASIENGLEGTEYEDRILGRQSDLYQAGIDSGSLLDSGLLNRIILYVTAVMEVKSSMGVVVAAPTAGACGTLPGSVVGTAHFMAASEDETTRAMLAAGMIGIFIAHRSSFAAEVGGCQAECGSASGMAAAALVTLAGGGLGPAIAAASMALQNSMGMVCDPVANRVEVPCLGKNVMAAANALSCANMALAGFDPIVPLDEVIEAMDQVGRSIPCELRCTALGGLSISPASIALTEKLAER